MRIGTRLVVLVSLLVVAVFAATVSITISRVNALSRGNAETVAAATARYYTGSVGGVLENALFQARSLATIFESAVASNGMKLDRLGVNALLRTFVERNADFNAVYVAFEPDAYDGHDAKFEGQPGQDATGRFMPYWTRDDHGAAIVQSLFDPGAQGSPDVYQLPKIRMKECIIEPHFADAQGKKVLVISLVVPILSSARSFVGVVGIDLSLDSIETIVKSVKVGAFASAYANTYSANGTVVGSIDESRIGKKVEETTTDKRFIADVHAGTSSVMVRASALLRKPVLSVTTSFPIGLTGTQWLVNVNIAMDDLMVAGKSLTRTLLWISSVAVLLVVVFLLLIARSISQPLQSGVAYAKKIAGGDLTASLRVGQREDEIGELAHALSAMSSNLRDLTRQIQQGAQQVSASAEQLAATAQNLSEGSQSQASCLEETSASIEELSSSIEQVAEHAQSQSAAVDRTATDSKRIVKTFDDIGQTLERVAISASASVEKARQGENAVSRAIESIRNISASSEKMAGIVGVISDIADQTNLLSLNAAIEAARAGEHGRGFAVVAAEVSKLAERSATSTKEITSLIRETLALVKQGVGLAEGSGNAMSEIIDGATQASAMVADLKRSMAEQAATLGQIPQAVETVNTMSQQISAATQEQTTNARQMSKAIESVNEITQQASAASEEMASSTEELASMAQQLQEVVAHFKLDETELLASFKHVSTPRSERTIRARPSEANLS
jgi:methyl-accepting chemotaxis protein